MKKFLLATIVIVCLSSPTLATHLTIKNQGCEPYYHNTRPNSIGSKIADIFFLRFTTVIEGAVYGVKKAISAKKKSTKDIDPDKYPPFCMTKALGKHLIERPVVNPLK